MATHGLGWRVEPGGMHTHCYRCCHTPLMSADNRFVWHGVTLGSLSTMDRPNSRAVGSCGVQWANCTG